MWVYWFQSVIIGIFNFIGILQLKNFSTKDFKIGGRPAQPTRDTKNFTAFFFLFHYGLFHVVYLIFISNGMSIKIHGREPTLLELKYIFITILIFLLNHFFSYVYNKLKDTKKKNIGSLMFFPYIRILPMHFTLMFGLFIGDIALPFFLMLKTIADGYMHLVKHNTLKNSDIGELQNPYKIGIN